MPLSKKEQALLDSLGVKLSNEDYVRPVEEEPHTKEMAKWEAQSLLVSLNWPYPELTSVKCWSCGEYFLTNYKANVYCSMKCFKVELEKKGIVWKPDKSFYEQWGNLEPPLMIPPEAIKAMRRLLSIVDSGIDRDREQQYQGLGSEDVHMDQIDDSVSLDPQVPYNDPDIPEEQPKDVEESEDSFLSLLASLDDS